MTSFKVFTPALSDPPKDSLISNEYGLYDNVLLGLSTIPQRKDGGKDNNIRFATRFEIEGYCGASSNTTAFTCPAGKRAYICFLGFDLLALGAGEELFSLELQTFSGALEVFKARTMLLHQQVNLHVEPAQGLVLEAGESIKGYTDNQNVYVYGFGYLIDAL